MNISYGQKVILWGGVIFLFLLELNVALRVCPSVITDSSACGSEKVWQSLFIGAFTLVLLFLVFSKGKRHD